MAIVQISQIKHRRGVAENLPQLASAELGWAVDSQELYIGNGTLAEGAPEVGNTRILTENDLPNVAYSTSITLTNNTSANANVGGSLFFSNTTPSVLVDYSVQRGNSYKTGQLKIAHNSSVAKYTDSFIETSNIGLTLSVVKYGTITAVNYKLTNTGIDANIKYTLTTVTWP